MQNGDQNKQFINFEAPPIAPAPAFRRSVHTVCRSIAVLVLCYGLGYALLQWDATVGGAPVGWPLWSAVPAATLLWCFYPWWANRHDDWRMAERLKRQVLESEEAQHRRLTGGEQSRINLGYRRIHVPNKEAKGAVAKGCMFKDAPDTPDILAYYRRLRPRRLVITGVPGSGKTSLAVELLIALIRQHQPGDPVPVRVPLSTWDPCSTPLAELLTDHLVKAYGWHRRRARQFVADRHVLPFLDGLDEMDPPRPDGNPNPAAPRARAALDRLNKLREGQYTGAVVLTCRSNVYRALGKGRTIRGPKPGESSGLPGARLTYAARVELTNVTGADARTYLANRVDHDRWEPLLARLDARPGRLVDFLSSPWRLTLAVTAFDGGGDPMDLTRVHSDAELDDLLLAQYIPAAADELTPGKPPYRARKVHRWLHRLARHTKSDQSRTGDLLHLHEMWSLMPGWVTFTHSVVVLALGGAYVQLVPELSGTEEAVIQKTALFPAVVALVGAVSPQKRYRSPWRWYKDTPLIFSMSILAPTPVGMFMAVNYFGPLAGPWTMGILLMTYWLHTLPNLDPKAVSPRELRSNNIKIGIAYSALALSTTWWDVIRATAEIDPEFVVASLAYVLLLCGAAPNLRHSFFRLCALAILPPRLGRFLDWSVQEGLLRHTGSAYQFRHGVLRDWLDAHPWPPR